MKEKKTTNIIIAILVIIIIALGTLVGLLATNTISFTKASNTNNPKTNAKEDENKETDEKEEKLLTNDEAKELIKKSYNQTIRDFFKGITYCGEYTSMSETESQYFIKKYGMSYGFNYTKSATFKSVKELDDYLKQYATQNLINENQLYNSKITSPETGEVVSTYVEKDGALYCNTWGKGGPGIGEYQENESTFEVNNVTTNSITGKISAVYNDQLNNTKKTLTIEVEVIKENDKWLLNHYKES